MKFLIGGHVIKPIIVVTMPCEGIIQVKGFNKMFIFLALLDMRVYNYGLLFMMCGHCCEVLKLILIEPAP